MTEHKRAVQMGDVNNGVAVHSLQTGHTIAWDQAMIADREVNWHRRRVKEAFEDEPRPSNHLTTFLEMLSHFLSFLRFLLRTT